MRRKRFAQNFLRDAHVIQNILSALRPQVHEHLIEVGPGEGALTLPVLALTRQLEAIELDFNLIPTLRMRCLPLGRLTLHSQDVLTVNFATLQKDTRLLRLFGNLPYNISTPLIFHVLQYTTHIQDMLFMLQKEVADRLTATTGTKAYGCLSVMTQYQCQISQIFAIPPSAFYPQPKVYSSLVYFIPRPPQTITPCNLHVLKTIVQTAFGQRRKIVHNSLKKWVPDAVWLQAKIDPSLRAENLSVKDFVTLTQLTQ